MPSSSPSRLRDAPRLVAANDNALIVSARSGGFKRRLLIALTTLFLVSGAALHLVNLHLDSVTIAHTSRSAMIFGLVGLRRATHAVVEAQDDDRPADA